MKNILLSLITAFTLIACHHDDYTPGIGDLPPATQTGKHTAGCLVNGQVIIPYGESRFFNCFYQNDSDFSLGFSLVTNNNTTTKSVGISSLNQKLVEGQTYQLKNRGDGSKWGDYTIYQTLTSGHNDYSTTDTITGELKITHLDLDKAIISGTFWFDAVNAKGEKVEVREGRFDYDL